MIKDPRRDQTFPAEMPLIKLKPSSADTPDAMSAGFTAATSRNADVAGGAQPAVSSSNATDASEEKIKLSNGFCEPNKVSIAWVNYRAKIIKISLIVAALWLAAYAFMEVFNAVWQNGGSGTTTTHTQGGQGGGPYLQGKAGRKKVKSVAAHVMLPRMIRASHQDANRTLPVDAMMYDSEDFEGTAGVVKNWLERFADLDVRLLDSQLAQQTPPVVFPPASLLDPETLLDWYEQRGSVFIWLINGDTMNKYGSSHILCHETERLIRELNTQTFDWSKSPQDQGRIRLHASCLSCDTACFRSGSKGTMGFRFLAAVHVNGWCDCLDEDVLYSTAHAVLVNDAAKGPVIDGVVPTLGVPVAVYLTSNLYMWQKWREEAAKLPGDPPDVFLLPAPLAVKRESVWRLQALAKATDLANPADRPLTVGFHTSCCSESIGCPGKEDSLGCCFKPGCESVRSFIDKVKTHVKRRYTPDKVRVLDLPNDVWKDREERSKALQENATALLTNELSRFDIGVVWAPSSSPDATPVLSKKVDETTPDERRLFTFPSWFVTHLAMGIPTIAHHGVAGVHDVTLRSKMRTVVDMDEQAIRLLDRLIQSPAYRAELTAEAVALAREYDPAAYTYRWLPVLRRLIDKTLELKRNMAASGGQGEQP
ncbi:unnamed protein product [Vitrella brassicaformis CCMP3155]|uniref:Uncharacterized protein n=1 Tax=Vitrella brassicaformis (strain CCMP3155) TaxID=1169540 RepID=A0A0G4G612_VITBC|nr:unnamed protein product [Vitrella brassicaformis CCMP3155]|eukprot:CEM23949.1 unnamed protein product [Vitrella brassicaformis CCMP3155]